VPGAGASLGYPSRMIRPTADRQAAEIRLHASARHVAVMMSSFF
jgi:hypothetical protein